MSERSGGKLNGISVENMMSQSSRSGVVLHQSISRKSFEMPANDVKVGGSTPFKVVRDDSKLFASVMRWNRCFGSIKVFKPKDVNGISSAR